MRENVTGLSEVRRKTLVLNYNGAVDTTRCVRSILSDRSIRGDEIIIVDNGSSDDSLGRLKAEFPDIRFVENRANLGYAEGLNTAIRRLTDEGIRFFFLLNNDTLVPPGTIDALQETLCNQTRVGIVGPAILEMGSEVVQSLGATMRWSRAGSDSRYAGHAYATVPHTVESVDYVSGCAMLLDAEVLREVGLFDSRLFMYSEEVDMCLKTANHGYKILCDSRVAIEHRKEATSKRYPDVRNRYMTRNRIIVMKRYAPPRDFVVGLLWILLYENTMTSVRSTARHEPLRNILARWRGLVEGVISSANETRTGRMGLPDKSNGQ